MTNQSVFNKVVKHLLTQKERSVDDDDKCMYYGPKGRKCAIGVLIPRLEYDPYMEGLTIYDLLGYSTEFGWDFPFDNPRVNIDLLDDLREVHDVHPVYEWYKLLKSLAKKYNLKFNPPKEYQR